MYQRYGKKLVGKWGGYNAVFNLNFRTMLGIGCSINAWWILFKMHKILFHLLLASPLASSPLNSLLLKNFQISYLKFETFSHWTRGWIPPFVPLRCLSSVCHSFYVHNRAFQDNRGTRKRHKRISSGKIRFKNGCRRNTVVSVVRVQSGHDIGNKLFVSLRCTPLKLSTMRRSRQYRVRIKSIQSFAITITPLDFYNTVNPYKYKRKIMYNVTRTFFEKKEKSLNISSYICEEKNHTKIASFVC